MSAITVAPSSSESISETENYASSATRDERRNL